MKYVQKHFFKEKFMCAPSFLVYTHLTTCACAHTRTQLRGNIAYNAPKSHICEIFHLQSTHSTEAPPFLWNDLPRNSKTDDFSFVAEYHPPSTASRSSIHHPLGFQLKT